MTTTREENGSRPLSTADLARAARRPEGTSEERSGEDVDYVQEEVTRLDVAQPPSLKPAGGGAAARGGSEQERASMRRDAARGDTARSESSDPGSREREMTGARDTNDGGMTDQRELPGRRAMPREREATAAAMPGSSNTSEALDPLFASGLAESFRQRWTSIQSGFVDDPKQAVRRGDELVAEVMSNLAESFAAERQRMEAQLDETGEGATENLRVALRRYRSFFERLLSL